MVRTGTTNDPRKRCDSASPPTPTKKKHEKPIKGHAGQPVGLMELSWRRGCVGPELPAKELPNDEACRLIAKEIPQFKDELYEIKIAMKELDAGAVFTPKGHCELADRGLECSWGVTKMMFRKENATLDDDKKVNNLKQRVKKIIASIPVETYQHCSRREREHKLSYATILRNDTEKVDLKTCDIEKMKKFIKSKRCAMDQDFSLVKEMTKTIIDVDAEIAAAKKMKIEITKLEECGVKTVK